MSSSATGANPARTFGFSRIKALHRENAALQSKLSALETANALAGQREAQEDRDMAALEVGLHRLEAAVAYRRPR